MAQTSCPKCGSTNIVFQREQTGNIGAGTNRVVIENGKGHGCLYWVIIGWWWKPLYFIILKLYLGIEGVEELPQQLWQLL